jgi:hypothetical protein
MKRNIRTSSQVEQNPEEAKEVQPVQSKNEFWEAVTGAAIPKQKASPKDKMETLTPPERLRKLVDTVVEQKKKEKEAEAARETAEVDVIDWASDKQTEAALASNFQKSFRIQGIKEMVTFVTSDRFSGIGPDECATLKEIFGRRFDEMVQKKVTISLLDSVISSQELQAELMERIGKENFPKFFKADVAYTPVTDFDRKIFSLGFARKVIEQIRGIVRQAKPSLK